MIVVRRITWLIVGITLLPGCWQSTTLSQTCVIPECFSTERDSALNVDSVAIWHGESGQHWIIATAKTGNTLPVYDACTGELLKTIGSSGKALGQLDRPNGIAVQDDFLFIVERNNRRLHIFQLPEGKPIAMREGDLGWPYGIAVYKTADKTYMVYVTDNAGKRSDVQSKKIYQYQVSYDDKNMHITLIRVFGDKQGSGALLKVESIAVDPLYNRLFIADEHASRKNVKIYSLDGQFTGQTIGDALIKSEPEGIAVYEVGAGGYVVVTDQDKQNNTFVVFDRITLEPICTFMGEKTRNTDGIAITNKQFGPFSAGALYVVHDDGCIHAYDWQALVHTCLNHG